MRPYIREKVMYQDSPREGGLWLRTLCQTCNELASKYDRAYGDLSSRTARFNRLQRQGLTLPGMGWNVPAIPVSPGRVARSVLYGMAALAPSLDLVHHDFLNQLYRDVDELRLPGDLQLRVARVNHPQCRISSAYWMQQVIGERQNYDVFAEICFYPFVWVLHTPQPKSLGPSLIDREGWGDATDWIRYSTAAHRSDLRDVLDRLPLTVHPTRRDRVNWIELSSNEDSYVLEGLVKRGLG